MKIIKKSKCSRAYFCEMVMFRNPRVLIVDDDKDVRKILQYVLTSYSMEVTLCENGTEALLAVMGGTFDYIITDFQMPGMNGVELVRRLRPMLQPLAVIIGMSAGDTGGQFLEAGANDFISKPFVPYNVAMMIDGRDLLV